MCSYGKLKGKLQFSEFGYQKDAPHAMRAIWELFPFVFRINENNFPGQTTLTILEKVCKERGWKEFGEDDGKLPGGNVLGWNLWWRSVVMMHTQTRSLYSWQYTNHIPKAIHFCNKEYLASYIRIMEDRFGEIFSFCPHSFTLPREHEELEVEHEFRSRMNLFDKISSSAKNLVHAPLSSSANTNEEKENGSVDASGDKSGTDFHPRKKNKWGEPNFNSRVIPPPPSRCYGHIHSRSNKNKVEGAAAPPEQNQNQQNQSQDRFYRPLWICKPVGKSQGRGIFLIDDLSNLPDHPVTIVQEYISNPLLISGYKFDLRLYVTIVSVSPLTIYAYREGLTRFATEPYDLGDLTNTCSHLTNASLNKLSPGYERDKTIVGHGCKWTLKRLRQYLTQNVVNGKSDWLMWQKIMSIIVLTIVGEVGQHAGIPATRNNFEFLGYDILIDSNLQPWLLEANLSPGLGGDCEVDEVVKKPMLHDLFDLLGLPDSRPYLSLVPASSLRENDANVIAIDSKSNTAIKLTSEAEILDDHARRRPSTSVSEFNRFVRNESSEFECGKPIDNDENGNDNNSLAHSSGQIKSDQQQEQQLLKSQYEQTILKLADKTVRKQQQNKLKISSKDRDKISPLLHKRLLDATAIYSQNLATALCKSQIQKGKRRSISQSKFPSGNGIPEMTTETEAGRLNFLASTDWMESAAVLATATQNNFNTNNNNGNSSNVTSGSVNIPNLIARKSASSIIPHRPGVGLKRRSWYDSPKRHGDWIRLFPFDPLSFQMTRGHTNTDIKVIIIHLKQYLKMAEELFTREPMQSDEFYQERMMKDMPWNTEIWLPPK